MVSVLVTFSPEEVVVMAMLVIDSDTSAVLPFGNTLVQVNCGLGSPAAVQLRTAGLGERTFTSMGLPSRVTETIKHEKNKLVKALGKTLIVLSVELYCQHMANYEQYRTAGILPKLHIGFIPWEKLL